jgi:hypothetical protein
VVSVTDPYGRILGFLDRNRYFFFQVAPQLHLRGRVNRRICNSLKEIKPDLRSNLGFMSEPNIEGGFHGTLFLYILRDAAETVMYSPVTMTSAVF